MKGTDPFKRVQGGAKVRARARGDAALLVHPPSATLAARLRERDRAAFVGRARELRMVDALLRADSHLSVLLVHGPPGIGKSVLMREIARRGAALNHVPLRFDGAELRGDPAALRERLSAAWEHERPLILVDGTERAPRTAAGLRDALLPSLPARTALAVAGRCPPERGWFENGWETVAAQLALGPLSADESRALLANRGLAGDHRVPAIVRWADGWPLALKQAADAALADPAWGPDVPGPAAAVRDALRSLHVPADLAASPLASGRGISERADSVRTLMREAAEHAFGQTSGEQLLKRVLVRGYLDPAPSHEHAAGLVRTARCHSSSVNTRFGFVTAYWTRIAQVAPFGPPGSRRERSMPWPSSRSSSAPAMSLSNA
jgi:hypothetical protein